MSYSDPRRGSGRVRVMARPMSEAPRPRPRPHQPHPRRPHRLGSVLTILVVLGGGLLLATMLWLPRSTARPIGEPSPRAPAASSGARGEASAVSTRSPSATASPTATTEGVAAATSLPARGPRSTPLPTTSAEPTRRPGAAPATAAEFDIESQVIAITFPLKEGARYRYRDNFGDAREGHAENYNHARVRRKGELLRAHDGIDIYAAAGTPVVAPFDGVVIDPAERWEPWIKERYGRTAAIVSDEDASEGYAALLTHLEAVYVEPGQRVHRGEVVGTVGDSGNAEGGRAHLHFELRAPFRLSWLQVGEDRLIDAFNPFPSLRAADPKRSD